MIKHVEEKDRTAWNTLDRDFPDNQFEEKVRNKQGYVCIADDKIIGILRYNLFWDTIPFCTKLFIEEEYRGKGYGKQLMEFWEQDMNASGFDMVMTSTQVNEDAQHFYRTLGYRDSGGFTVDVPGHEQPMELIMIKALAPIDQK